MITSEQWVETLQCPDCKTTGLASFFQPSDDVVPIVESVPAGFMVVHAEFGPRFRCERCGVPVNP